MGLGSSLQDGRIWGAAIGAATLLIALGTIGLWIELRHQGPSTRRRAPEMRWTDRVPPAFVVAISVLGASAFVGTMFVLVVVTLDD